MLKNAGNCHFCTLYQPKLWHHNNDMAYSWSLNPNTWTMKDSSYLCPSQTSPKVTTSYSFPCHGLLTTDYITSIAAMPPKVASAEIANCMTQSQIPKTNFQTQLSEPKHHEWTQSFRESVRWQPIPNFNIPQCTHGYNYHQAEHFQRIYRLGVQKLLQELNSIPLLW
jgi:hypothetical protein